MAQLLCVATLQEAEAVIAQFEVEHTVQFKSLSSTKNFGKVTLNGDNDDCVTKDKVTVRLKDSQEEKTSFLLRPEDDNPFAILGKKTMACIYGRDFKRLHKIRVRESRAILGLTSQRREIISKCKDCPAKIVIRHIVSFTGYKESKLCKDVFTRKLRKKLKNKEPVPHEHRYYIRLPGACEHANHPTGEDAGLRYSMAAPLKTRILELVKLGVHSPKAIKIHLRFMVENELFKGKTPPPKSNCMYWPTHKAVYSCVYRYKRGGAPLCNKHFNRNYEVVPQNLISTENDDLLHQIVDEAGLDETVGGTGKSASVSAPKRLKTKTTSTHGNRLSNPSLQHNEAIILTSLSQMDGTKQNILPTIKVINPSHYLGEGELFLNGLSSQQEIIHRNASAPNMANSVQRNKKGTRENEHAQQGHFIQLCQIQQNANGVEEGQTSLVFVPSEAMQEWSDSMEIEMTPTTSQQICQPSIETPLEAQGTLSDQCVLVDVQESQCASTELESINQKLSSTDSSPLITDTYTEEISVLTSPQDEIESQWPTAFANHSAPQCSSSISELGPELSATGSLYHIAHDHGYGNSLGKGKVTAKPVDVSKKVTVQRQEPKVKPNLDLPTSCVEHLKDLLETRDIPNIVSAFLNVPSLKLELVQQLVKGY